VSAHHPIRNYDRETAHHYAMTEADFIDTPTVETIGGVEFASGYCKRGDFVTVPLHAPLCKSCDDLIVGGVCHKCQVVHVDLVEPLTDVCGDPLNGIGEAA
jgi:hypothetical protein